MIVMKFGGTSIGSGAAIARVADIVASRLTRQPIVIVSALARVTDQLLDAARRAGEGDLKGALEVVELLRDRHESAIDDAIGREDQRRATQDSLATHLAELSLILEALALLRNRGPQASDIVASYGELLSAEIVTAALRHRDLDAVHVDARDVVITDATFGRAVPDLDVLADRARRLVAAPAAAGRVPVMQGFVGATTDRLPTTLGRGGSDYSAALIGAALPASEVEIWTDVDGFMTADPRVVPAARTLAEVSYDEAAELAFFGARVLHPATVLPLVNQRIPVRILNSCRPDNAGTTIVASRAGALGDVRSIAFKSGIATVTLRAPRMLGAHGFLGTMFGIFWRHGVAVDVVTTSEVSVSLSLDTEEPDARLLADLRELGELTVNPNRAVVCVVGEGLRGTPGLPGRVFQALQTLNIEMISLGASKINLTFILDQRYADEAVRRLHDEFFGNG